MKIVAFEVEDWERDVFEALEADHEVVYESAPLTAENAQDFADAEAVSTFIDSSLSSEVLEQLPELGLVATRSTGFDHVDAEICEARGIEVRNVPTYGRNTVAEHAFGPILAIAHRLVEAADRTRRGSFDRRGLRGFDLCGKTLGVVGTGHIGRHTVEMAKGFRMEVLAHDVVEDEDLAREFDVAYVDLHTLLEGSDIVSLHVPLNEDTEGMLGASEIERMREGAVLINTARGAVCDIQAVAEALTSGRLSAAGFDVLPEEPAISEEAELLRRSFREPGDRDLETLLADHVLMRMRNVILTPHTAFDTHEAVRRILDTTLGNIQTYARGEARNVVIG